MRRFRSSLIGLPLAFGFLAAGSAAAQEAEPLRKSGVIRLLSGATYTEAEVAEIIRTSCLTFEPTARDIEDFRSVGAGDEVIEAVEECGRSGAREGGAAGGEQQAPAAAPMQLSLSDSTVSAAAGDSVTLTARVIQGNQPRAGVRLALSGIEDVNGTEEGEGEGEALEAVTGQDGRAEFRISAGTTAGRYELRVGGVDASVEGEGRAVLSVTPAAPDRVQVEPRTLRVGADETEGIPVRVRVGDAFGNPVPDRRVVLLPEEAGAGETGWEGRTRQGGDVTITIPSGALADEERLDVRVEGESMAMVRVDVEESPAEEEEVAEGLTADSVEALLAEADELREREAPGRALSRYERVLEEQPENVEALIGAGYGHLDGGQAEQAEDLFRRALRTDSTRTDAARGLARAALSQEDVSIAIRQYERITRREPDDVEAWTDLGRAYRQAGQEERARESFREALALDPEREDAREGLQAIGYRPLPPAVELSVWGGATFDNSRPMGPRHAEVAFWPISNLRVWGRYDDALNLSRLSHERGEVDYLGIHGGGLVEYGEGERFTTRAQFGRRWQPPGDIIQNLFQVEQEFRAGDEMVRDFERVSVRVGGLLGHWFDRDDWLLNAAVGIPVSPRARLEPQVVYGETLGNVASTLRIPAREARFTLAGAFRLPGDFRVEPALGIGTVDSDAPDAGILDDDAPELVDGEIPDRSGELFDALLRASAPVGELTRARLFLRYQEPPGMDSFLKVAFGLSVGVPR